jgi:hypothetical protein
MVFDLGSFLQSLDLEVLILPFTRQEIDGVVKDIPLNKAPRHNSFSGLFLKKCWYIIHEDFYTLIMSGLAHNANLKCINNSFVSLVPKKLNPERVSEFRPISLLNLAVKFLTKILANR